MTLSEIRSRVLASSPEAVAVRQELLIGSSQLEQSRRFHNPELSMDVENFGGQGVFSGSQLMEVTVQVSQVIELGGKHSARITAAEAELAKRKMLITKKEALLRLAAGNAFLEVMIGRQRLRQALHSKEIADRIFRTVKEKVEAGKVPAMELPKVRITKDLADSELMQAETALEREKRSLAALWGESDEPFTIAGGALDLPPTLPPKARFISKWQQSPHWQFAQQHIEAEKARMQVILAGQIPDITLSAGVRHHEVTSDIAWVAGASIPLPLFDRQEGNSQAARHRVRQVELENNALQKQLRNELDNSYRDFSSAHTYALKFQQQILPEAEKAYLSVQQGYELGRFSQLELLHAQRTLFSVQSLSLEGKARFFRAGLQLEYLTAESIYDDNLQIILKQEKGESND